MRVFKLTEAAGDSARVSSWQGAYNDAQGAEEKEQVFKNIFHRDLNLINVGDKLLSFGIDFIDNWLQAMKFAELDNKNNDLMALFKMSESNPDNWYYLKNKNNFKKLYNTYANDYLIKEYFNDNNTSDVYNELINNPRMYQFNDDEYKSIFKTFNDLVNKGLDKGKLKFVFLENDKGKVTGDVNQIPTINNHIELINKRDNNNLSNTGRQLKSFDEVKYELNNILTKYPEAKQYMQELISEN